MSYTPKAVGAGYGFEFILWCIENLKKACLIPVPLAITTMYYWNLGVYWFIIFYPLWLVTPFALLICYLLISSWTYDWNETEVIPWETVMKINDTELASQFKGKKLPMETAIEAYFDLKADFLEEDNLIEVLKNKNKIFRFGLTKSHVNFFFKEFLNQITGHSREQDHREVGDVYNRGNDFYNWFLGDTMIYTSGMWQKPEDTLRIAQFRKLDTIASYIQLKEGDEHLDIGCGWGTLIRHYAKKYGSKSAGCTLAEEQVKWGMDLAEKEGVQNKIEYFCCDYRLIPSKNGNKKYDKITCLEMAEHVGVKNFTSFLLQVNDMLKDDGIFYLQIAGLRRHWHWEDLIWGLFMDRYIFPGADNSCPLANTVSHLERAGFEVHRVENMGVHYSKTIEAWYLNWISNKNKVIEKYGKWWYRIWSIFLSWSTIIARQGSSTVFMITCNKNTRNDKSSVGKEEGKNMFARLDRWIGPNVVASQQ